MAVVVILVMSAFAVCTLASFCSQLSRIGARRPGAIAMNEERFAQARAALPPRGTIGYLSDTGGTAGVLAQDLDKDPKDYYLTQYYLAPVVVAPGTGHELIIANFASPAAVARFAALNTLTVERDFSNGTALLRRRP